MCRFLLFKSEEKLNPEPILRDFAEMCRVSRTEDEDWQGDGWGAAWFDEKGNWQVKKSLLPIWKDRNEFKSIPGTNILVAHARSASFDEHKGNVDFNEPYLKGGYCYVFNGMLKGVKLVAEGRIGAQKVWSLLQNELVTSKPLQALENINRMLRKNSRTIRGLNIGLATKDSFFALCGKQGDSDYFTLRKMRGDDIQIICSEEIGDYQFEKMKENETIAL